MSRNRAPKALTPIQQSHRLDAIYAELCADFGGEGQLSTIQKGLLRRAAMIQLRGEIAERDLAAGEAIDMQRYAGDCAMLLRILSRLGARAVAAPQRQETLAEFLAAHDEPERRDDQAGNSPAQSTTPAKPPRLTVAAALAQRKGAADPMP